MSSKITIIGAGSVGSTIAYTLAHDEIASEIVLIDIKRVMPLALRGNGDRWCMVVVSSCREMLG